MQDNAISGLTNKGYAVRVSPSATIAGGDIWRSTAIYRVRRFATLAETVLTAVG